MKEKWDDRFRQSLSKWRRAPSTQGSALDLGVETGDWLRQQRLVESEETDALLKTCTELMIRQAFRGLADGLTESACCCQSPIEEAMLSALIVAAGASCEQVFLRVGKRHFGYLTQGLDSLTIEPQAQIGEVRVDFLLRYKAYGPWFSGEVPTLGGKVVSGVEKNLIVECDGHEYHERTKTQASRDRSRDRWLQKLGYPVYRYTGSDIWQDVFHCAGEAVEFLLGKAEAGMKA